MIGHIIKRVVLAQRFFHINILIFKTLKKNLFRENVENLHFQKNNFEESIKLGVKKFFFMTHSLKYSWNIEKKKKKWILKFKKIYKSQKLHST